MVICLEVWPHLLCSYKEGNVPWMVWLSELGTRLQTKGLLV